MQEVSIYTQKQTVYIAPKSTHESLRITAPEPVRGDEQMDRQTHNRNIIISRPRKHGIMRKKGYVSLSIKRPLCGRLLYVW